jgi:isoquinoline 1-oxidoreductase subunit alpha
MTQFTLNGKPTQLDTEADMPLLWAIRDLLGMTGTKYGCGQGLCGACTVHIDGVAVRSCVMPMGAVEGKNITTIEGLGADKLHPVQQAWIDNNVPQCGYCQPGQIMSASALLAQNPSPTDTDIDNAMAGNLCRCGTYVRIRKAIHDAADIMQNKKTAAAVHYQDNLGS